jgi:heme/copper-type cytochrome/quinol oxidase subunit 2
MTKFLVIRKRNLQLAGAFLVVTLLAAVLWRVHLTRIEPAIAAPTNGVQVFTIVTGEFETKDRNGKMLEAYRWDPGSIYVRKGVPVELRIIGISGDTHPFVIDGLDVKDEVKKGETTVVRFTPEQAGTYEIRCLTHADMRSDGPMVGYIFVQ